jgi:hypothetical protein
MSRVSALIQKRPGETLHSLARAAARLERERGGSGARAPARPRDRATRRRDAAARGLKRTAPPESKDARRARAREIAGIEQRGRTHDHADGPYRALARGKNCAGLCVAARPAARDLAAALAPRAVTRPPAPWPGHALTRRAGGQLVVARRREAPRAAHSGQAPDDRAPWPASRPRRGGVLGSTGALEKRAAHAAEALHERAQLRVPDGFWLRGSSPYGMQHGLEQRLLIRLLERTTRP